VAPDALDLAHAVELAARLARDEGFAHLGEAVVVAGGIPFGQPGTTNTIRVATVK
jgi:pyruvate kinase